MLRNYSTAAYSDLDLGNFEMEEEEEEVFDHQAIAHRWLEELGLADAAHTKVEHLSGGEAKRLVVAAELTADEMPNLVCCDEPLSGLDSHSAETVVRALRRLTDVHPLLTIVTSIHQPSAEVLALYDQLYVLARGGVCIFSGLPAQIQSTLEQASASANKSSTSFSPFPIENLIRQSCLGPEESTNQALVELTRSHFSTTSFQAELSEQTALVADGVQHNRARFTAHSVVVLARRQLSYITAHLWKEWLFFALCSTAFGASLRLLYSADRISTVSGCLNLEDDLSQCRAKNATDLEKEFALKDNLIYGNFFCAFYLMLVLLAGARSFLHDYELFSNEHRNGAYSTGSWYLIKSTVEMVPLLPCIALFVAIVDIYEEAVPDQVRPLYPHVVLLLVLGVLATTAQGHLVSLLAGGNLTGQTVLVIAVFLLGQLLQNYVIPIGQMHYLWQVGATFSVSRYLLESLMVLQYGFGRCLPRVEVQAVLYAMDIDIEGESDSRNFYAFNLAMLALNCLLFRLLALWVLVKRANPIDDRKGRVERLEEYRKKLKEVLTEQKISSRVQMQCIMCNGTFLRTVKSTAPFSGIEKTYHRFSVMATSTFLIAELTWLAAFTEQFAGKNKALDLIYELSSSLERDLTSGQQERQIRWFNRAHFFIGWYVKSNYAGILSQMLMIWGIILRSWYIKGSISLLEVPLYLFLSASSNHLGAFAIVFSTFLINDLFFMIGVFKCKLDRCWRLLRTLLLSNNSINNSHYALHCFDHQYGDLHRQLNMYNCFASKFIYMSNMIVKVAANITFTILLSQGNLASNYIGLVIIFCYIFGYFSLQLVFLILAYFPGQNLLVFKAVSGFSAHQALLTATVNERYNSYPSNRINRSNLKYLLKLNNLTHFLTNNQFGFTYSVFYLVQKWDILDNTFYTFYLLLLFYKRYI
ncbi:ABC protein, sub ABCG [Tyrophagus putrescentiae]|nr:ABC protein, sub ABCG [Tyrophagus putrescentiae]